MLSLPLYQHPLVPIYCVAKYANTSGFQTSVPALTQFFTFQTLSRRPSITANGLIDFFFLILYKKKQLGNTYMTVLIPDSC